MVAIDVGASSGRVLRGILRDGVLTVEECVRFANGPVAAEGGDHKQLEWDIASLWQGVLDGLRESARRGSVDAIGIDTWAVDYGLIGDDGALLGNPACYRSGRTAAAVEHVHSVIPPDALYSRNGLQFQPFNTLYQLVADQSRVPPKNVRRLLLLPDLLGYWLTGRAVCEVTNASTTGLINPQTRSWEGSILEPLREHFGVEVPEILAELVEPGTILGGVHLDVRGLHTSRGTTTPVVVVGSHDTASAVVAVPARDAVERRRASAESHTGAFGFISAGTWSLVGIEIDTPILSEASRAANFTNELGVDSTIRYLKNIMGMWIQQECIRQWYPHRRPGWQRLDAETAAAPPLRTVFDINDPSFAAPGEMTSRIDAAVRACGEPIPRGTAEYLRAITESMVVAYARAMREASELSGVAPESIHIVGGGSRNQLLCQLTADATGLPVIAGPVEGTGIGNMMVQLRAIGAISGGLDEMRTVVANSVETARFAPRADALPLWVDAEARVFA